MATTQTPDLDSPAATARRYAMLAERYTASLAAATTEEDRAYYAMMLSLANRTSEREGRTS